MRKPMTPEREAELWAKIAAMNVKLDQQAYHQTRLQRSLEKRKVELDAAVARAERAEAALARATSDSTAEQLARNAYIEWTKLDVRDFAAIIRAAADGETGERP